MVRLGQIQNVYKCLWLELWPFGLCSPRNLQRAGRGAGSFSSKHLLQFSLGTRCQKKIGPNEASKVIPSLVHVQTLPEFAW